MSNSQVVEVAAGLFLIFFITSTACSSLKELIAKALDLRATTLESAISRLLSDNGKTLTTKLLQNHLIAGTVREGQKPPYVSSRNFALALFELIAPASPDHPRTIEDLKKGVAALPDPARGTILTLIDSAQQDVGVARQRVENWFDDAMERVGGAYKRRAQAYIALLGVLLCAALNVDTVMIVRELWNDDAIRTAIARQAQQQASPGQTASACTGLECVANSIRSADVPPIGWARSGFRSVPSGAPAWLLKILGIVISSVAVAMGAPFWFDMLNKVVNMRLTGDPPPDSRQPAAS